MMFAFENEPAVNLVAHDHHIAIADRGRDLLDVLLRQHATSRVLRRIQDDQLRPIVDQARQLIHIEPKIHFLA